MTSAPAPDVRALAARLEGRLAGVGDVRIGGVNALEEAGPDEITFIADAAHGRRFASSKAAAAVVSEGIDVDDASDPARPLIYVRNAEIALAALLEHFAPPDDGPPVGVHATAFVHPTARLGADVRIGAHVSVDAQCVVGDGVVLHPGVRLYPGVAVGDGTVLHANGVVRARCRIGRGVILHQNVSIGADGFGYRPSPDGRSIVKMPHIGDVVIEDGVEIGAGTTVDRGKFGSTVIGAGSKIDNLVMIAHNCRIGRGCLIAANTGLAGSTVLEDRVVLGGGVGVADHRRIGAGAVVGAYSGVMHDIPAGESWLGYPAAPSRDALRQWAAVRKLSRLDRGRKRGASAPSEASGQAASTALPAAPSPPRGTD